MIALKHIILALLVIASLQLQDCSETMTGNLAGLAAYLYTHLRSSHLNSTPLQTILKANMTTQFIIQTPRMSICHKSVM